MDFPKDLRYTKDHEWARKDGETITLGITAFAVDQLGDITQVDLPEVGSAAQKDETFGTIESVKSVSDLFAPCSGEVVKINEALEDSPELVNDAPYGDGWMVEIKVAGDDFESLMVQAAYSELVAKED